MGQRNKRIDQRPVYGLVLKPRAWVAHGPALSSHGLTNGQPMGDPWATRGQALQTQG